MGTTWAYLRHHPSCRSMDLEDKWRCAVQRITQADRRGGFTFTSRCRCHGRVYRPGWRLDVQEVKADLSFGMAVGL